MTSKREVEGLGGNVVGIDSTVIFLGQREAQRRVSTECGMLTVRPLWWPRVRNN